MGNVPSLSGVEALLITLRINKSWLMVMGVYKPPKFKFNMWKDQLYNLFEYASSACEDMLVLGDLNCDILHPSNNGSEGRHLLGMCGIFNLDCLINEPTRLTPTSQTLIDVLLTNNKRRFLVSRTLEPHVSDHRLVFTVMKASHRHKKSMMITSRSYKCYDKEKFLSDLSAVPFHVPFIFDNVDDQVWAFHHLFNTVVSECAPVKRFHICGGHVRYITPEWRRERNRLWKKCMKQHSESSWSDYKKQRNVCTSLWRKAIGCYFQSKAQDSVTKPQEFWKFFGPIFRSKHSHSNDINLIEGNNFLRDKQQIASIFNDFFVNIASSVHELNDDPFSNGSSDHSSILHIKNFMQNNDCSDNFSFKSTNPVIVMGVIHKLSSSKAAGYDNIPVRLVKDSAGIIADPLAKLFNTSVLSGGYPTPWKYGQVTPVFKKGDENLKSNYRPITVLVAFNNIFERILSMCNFAIIFRINYHLTYQHTANTIAARLRYYVCLRN